MYVCKCILILKNTLKARQRTSLRIAQEFVSHFSCTAAFKQLPLALIQTHTHAYSKCWLSSKRVNETVGSHIQSNEWSKRSAQSMFRIAIVYPYTQFTFVSIHTHICIDLLIAAAVLLLFMVCMAMSTWQRRR